MTMETPGRSQGTPEEIKEGAKRLNARQEALSEKRQDHFDGGLNHDEQSLINDCDLSYKKSETRITIKGTIRGREVYLTAEVGDNGSPYGFDGKIDGMMLPYNSQDLKDIFRRYKNVAAFQSNPFSDTIPEDKKQQIIEGLVKELLA